MEWAVALLLGFALGGALGAAIVAARLRTRLSAQAAASRDVQAKLDQAASAQVRLAGIEADLSLLRHDLHGILAPALLTADRLTGHADPVIRKAGDIVVRTVERATARLAATKQK